MRVIGGFLMVLFFTAMPVFAQEQPPSADDIVSKMQSKLNLTQDQVTAITPIIEKYTSQREQLRQSAEDGTADRDSMRSQMKQLKEDEKQDLSQVLSADQLSQWEQMQGQMRKHGGDGNGGGSWGGGGRPQGNEGEGTGNMGGGDNPPPQN
jgi:hypothetical protein